MPLIKSASDKAIGPNIKTEMSHGKPYKQALAIALSVQDRAGGANTPKHTDPLHHIRQIHKSGSK